MSADDLAAVREALDYGGDYLPTQNVRDAALAALNRLAARLQEAERERQKADEELADKVGVEKALLAAEARDAALREALGDLLRYVPEGGATIRPGYGVAARRARAALAEKP